jgi:hypothetical protein
MLLKSVLLGMVLLCSMGAGPCWLRNQYVTQPSSVVAYPVVQPVYVVPSPVVVNQQILVPVMVNTVEYRVVNQSYLVQPVPYYAVPVYSAYPYDVQGVWRGYNY